MKITLSAHRCGTDKYPELTLSAARYSLECGADNVEMDIRFTKDGVPVISHDKDATKLFGSDKNVCDMTLQEFLQLRFLEDPELHPHTLEEILQSGVGPILFHIKEGGEELRAILRMIRAHDREDAVIMGVLTVEDVAIVKAFNPGIRVLAFMQKAGDTQAFIDAGAEIIRLWEAWVTPERIGQIHDQNREVWVMAGNVEGYPTGYTREENLHTWRRLGVNGIIINNIEAIRGLLS